MDLPPVLSPAKTKPVHPRAIYRHIKKETDLAFIPKDIQGFCQLHLHRHAGGAAGSSCAGLPGEEVLHTGIRMGEILGLNWEQIKNGQIYITETKTDRPRQIPINERLSEILKEQRKKIK